VLQSIGVQLLQQHVEVICVNLGRTLFFLVYY